MTDPQLGTLLTALDDLQGLIKLDGNHCYWKDKKRVPGVTTVIKTMDAPQLDAWKVRVQVEGTARAAFDNQPWENESQEEYVSRLATLAKEQFEHERIADQAADVGKQVHALIEHAIKADLGQPVETPEVSDEALFVFAGWKEWAEKVRLKPLMAEGRIYHPGHNFCGSFDLLCLVNGHPTLCDWKPTPTLYDERRLQLAAYRYALTALGWPEMEGAIVCLPRDGGEIEMVYADPPGPALDATFDSFLALLRVYNWKRELARLARKAA